MNIKYDDLTKLFAIEQLKKLHIGVRYGKVLPHS